MARIQKASGGDRKSENFKKDNNVLFEKPKAEILKDNGITEKQKQRYEALAKDGNF